MSNFPSRSWSFSSRRTSPIPGTSRQLLAGQKRRAGNVPVDVPSDDSDEERSQAKRPRVRQRQKSHHLNRRPPTDLGFSRRPSSSTDGSVKNLAVNTGNGGSGSPPSPASQSPPVRQAPVNVGSWSTGARIQTKANIPEKGPTSQRLKRRKSVIRFNGGEKDWTMFSLWMPSWKDKVKCDKGTLPAGSSELAKDILEAIEMISPFIADYKQRPFKLMRVQKTEEDGEGNAKITMKKCPFRNDPSPHPTSPELAYGEIRLISSDAVIGKIFSDILSVDDMVLLFKQSSDGRPDVLIHLTIRDCDVQALNPYHPGTFQKIYVHVHTSNDSPSPYYFPQWSKILQFYSLNFRWDGSGRGKAQNHNSSVDSSASVSSGIPVGDNPWNSDNPDSDGVPGAANSNSNSIDAIDDDDSVDGDSGQAGPVNVNFELERFARAGIILPGPMRAPVKKIDSTNNYTYHTLAELAKMLNKSMKNDSKGHGHSVVSGTIKHQCHTYGIVVKITTEHRHKGAYLVRINDGTMDSVLVRLHTSLSTGPGPTIQVGDVIRVHRLTVQIEWDSECSSNTMVLSTTQHFNYVLFRESSDNKGAVRYLTCAKSITLGDFDKARVAELLRLKQSSRIIIGEQEDEDDPFEDLLSAPQNRNVTVQRKVPLSHGSGGLNINDNKEVDELSTGTDGINTVDLDSPLHSVVSVEGSEPPLSSPMVADIEQEDYTRGSYPLPSVASVDGLEPPLSSPMVDDIEQDDYTRSSSPLPSVVSIGGSEPPLSSPIVADIEQHDYTRVSDESDVFQDASQELFSGDNGSEGSADSYETAETSFHDLEVDDADRSYVEASPVISSDLEETLQAGGILHLRQCSQPVNVETYTRFMNLTKNGSRPTLLCTLAELGAASGANTWRLIVQDGESTLPKEEFKNNAFLDDSRLDTHLVLNITNARRLAERGILSQVYDSLGTDELYIIENVEIQGDHPPYALEVDGDTCAIRLATYEDLSRNFNLTCTQGSNGSYSLSRAEIPSQDNLFVTPTKNSYKAMKRPGEASSDEIAGASNSSPRRIFGRNAGPTPSPVTSPNEGKPWDGKVTARRKRRQHYQREDSMEC